MGEFFHKLARALRTTEKASIHNVNVPYYNKAINV